MNDYSSVPQELKQLPNWVVWRAPSKVPYNPNNPALGAKANDCTTWGTYASAVNTKLSENFSGIGFELGGTDFCGIDFDNILDNGEPDPYVLEILEQLGSPYCEVSPSGTGLHAFIRCAALPGTKRKFSNGDHYGAEIYSGREKGRYFTITGQQFSGSGVPEAPDIPLAYFLLSQIHDNKFKKLWLGDLSDYANDQSRADLALAWLLAQAWKNDAVKIEWAFTASKLGQRDKWRNRPDYRARTIEKALTSKKEPSEQESKLSELMARTGDTIEPEIIQWLWQDRIPLGKITLFAGNPDNGKSLAANSVAAICTTGRPFPDSPNPNPPADVLMLLGEDDIADTAVPRLMAAEADLHRIHFVEGAKRPNDPEVRLDLDIPGIESLLDTKPNVRLLIIDPISNYLGGVSMVAEQEVRSILIPLKRLADRKNIAVIIVMHLNKKSELEAISRVGGAMAFIGVARCSWLFIRDASSVEGEIKETFTMARIKNNLAKASGSGLAYEVRAKKIPIPKDHAETWAPFVVWGSPVNMTADDAIEVKQNKGRGRPEGTDQTLQEAMQWLERALQDGPKTEKWIVDQADGEEGISKATLRRAKKQIKAVSRRAAGQWIWELPEMRAVLRPEDALLSTLPPTGDLLSTLDVE